MRNVTISLSEDLARWARVEAAKAGKSLSRWLAEKLESERSRTNEQAAAVEWFLSLPKKRLLKPGEQLPTKDEIYAERLLRHERDDLRTHGGSAGESEPSRSVAEDGEPFKRGDD
jgi:hypothetical protein